MKEKIVQCIAKVFNLKPNEIDASFDQEHCEKWDSLRHLDLVIELETAFGVSFNPDEIGSMVNLNAVESILERKQ